MKLRSEFIRKLVRRLKRWIGGRARTAPPGKRDDNGRRGHGVFVF